MRGERSLAVLQEQRRTTIKMIGERAIQKLSLINDVIERRSSGVPYPYKVRGPSPHFILNP